MTVHILVRVGCWSREVLLTYSSALRLRSFLTKVPCEQGSPARYGGERTHCRRWRHTKVSSYLCGIPLLVPWPLHCTWNLHVVERVTHRERGTNQPVQAPREALHLSLVQLRLVHGNDIRIELLGRGLLEEARIPSLGTVAFGRRGELRRSRRSVLELLDVRLALGVVFLRRRHGESREGERQTGQVNKPESVCSSFRARPRLICFLRRHGGDGGSKQILGRVLILAVASSCVLAGPGAFAIAGP